MRLALSMMLICVVAAGCSSEVDKCVDAEVKAWEIEQKQVRKKWDKWSKERAEQDKDPSKGRDFSFELGYITKPDERTKERVAADERVKCLAIAKVK